MASYLRGKLLRAGTSSPGKEARVGGVELNHATRLCWGSNLSRHWLCHRPTRLGDDRANVY